MKFNKKTLAFAICLAMYCPTKCEVASDEHRLTAQQETILAEVASVAAEGIMIAIENAIDSVQPQHPVSLQQAQNMLQALINSLVTGSTFEINNVKYVVTQAHKNITIGNQASDNDVQTISQDDAIELLQAYKNDLSDVAAFNVKSPIFTALHDDVASNDTLESQE